MNRNNKPTRSQRIWAVISITLAIAMLLSLIVSSFGGLR